MRLEPLFCRRATAWGWRDSLHPINDLAQHQKILMAPGANRVAAARRRRSLRQHVGFICRRARARVA
jgi:hypothetical protein